MTREYKYILNVKQGIGAVQGRKQFDADMKSIGEGKYVMTLKKYRAKRSISQNSFYHGAVLPAIRQGLIDMGFERHLLDLEATHDLLKNKFLKRDIANDEGQFISITLSTADMNKVQFGEYIDAIDRWSQEFLGFPIPLPNTQTKINY